MASDLNACPLTDEQIAAILKGVRAQVDWNGWEEPYVTLRFRKEYAAAVTPPPAPAVDADHPTYPAIWRAAVVMANDAGSINRLEPTEALRAKFDTWINGEAYEDVRETVKGYEVYLATLSRMDFETVCIGDAEERNALLETAPAGLNNFLNNCFDEVC